MIYHDPSRRQFLTGAAATLAIGPAFAQASANERMNLAIIGFGKRAYPILPQALRQPDTQVVAVCEIEGKPPR